MSGFCAAGVQFVKKKMTHCIDNDIQAPQMFSAPHRTVTLLIEEISINQKQCHRVLCLH